MRQNTNVIILITGPPSVFPSGYGSVSSVAGPTGNPLFTRHQIISGHAARDSAASPKKTQAKTSPQRFKRGPLSAKNARRFAGCCDVAPGAVVDESMNTRQAGRRVSSD